MAAPAPPAPSAPRPTPAEAQQRGLLTTVLIVGVALAVALLASFVWPSSPTSEEDQGAGAVDVTGPVGRTEAVATGPNTGGATDPATQLPGAGPGDYTQRPGTGSITAPIGGLEAVLGGWLPPRDPWVAPPVGRGPAPPPPAASREYPDLVPGHRLRLGAARGARSEGPDDRHQQGRHRHEQQQQG
jgi:hypothetical protein